MIKRLLVLYTLLYVWCGTTEAREIRVLLMEDKMRVKVEASSLFEIINKSTGSRLFTSKETLFWAAEGGIGIQGFRVERSSLIIDSDSLIRVENRRYRGKIEIRRGRRGLDLINIIDIEPYLYGVIKWEISPAWPMEVVKAQAVAARTFAYANIGRHAEDGYDLCRKDHCQVYGGVESEDPRATRAVDLTKGEVITLNGNLINSIYHATCGGETADASLVWEGNGLWYLKGVRCGFCRDSPHYYWSYHLSLSDVERALQGIGLRIGRIKTIYPIKRDRFGRIGELAILHTKGKLIMNANRFRLAIGSGKVRSTLFTLGRGSDYLPFNGRGWGHGVGMCQWGAKGMAECGFDYTEIIRYYYPDTTVSAIK